MISRKRAGSVVGKKKHWLAHPGELALEEAVGLWHAREYNWLFRGVIWKENRVCYVRSTSLVPFYLVLVSSIFISLSGSRSNLGLHLPFSFVVQVWCGGSSLIPIVKCAVSTDNLCNFQHFLPGKV